MSMRERMLAGEPYRVDSELSQMHEDCQELLARYNTSQPADRPRLLGQLFGSVGQNVVIEPRLACDYGSNIHVGDNVFINYDVVLLDVSTINIGSHCQFGPRVQILTATHPLDPVARRAGWESGQPVQIQDNVWLAAGVIVCPGVSVGRDSVIGAGSVVTRDIPAGVLAFGAPARPIRGL